MSLLSSLTGYSDLSPSGCVPDWVPGCPLRNRSRCSGVCLQVCLGRSPGYSVTRCPAQCDPGCQPWGNPRYLRFLVTFLPIWQARATAY